MLKICSLASGSKGNAIYIASDNTAILVDAGLSYSTLAFLMKEQLGVDIKDLSGIVITHEHSDHVMGLQRASNEGIPIYAHPKAYREIIRRVGGVKFSEVGFFDLGFDVGDITVNPFRVPHDTVYPLAYTFTSGGDKVSVATDMGHLTDGIVNNLKGSRIALIEANHDRALLYGNDKYPQQLKKRIDGPNGHLCNDVTAELAVKILSTDLEGIILGHLSEENNSPELAYATVTDGLRKQGAVDGRDLFVEIALQHKATAIF